MKILVVHNYYVTSVPSGENQVVEAEKKLLRQHGHEVLEFSRRSDELRSSGSRGVLRGALATPYNPFMVCAIKRTIREFQPDVVHVHNTFPLISPAIFHAIGSRAASVLTLHNYRLLCPAAIPLRHGAVCTSCLDVRSAWPSLLHGCYRNSRIATLPLTINVGLHRAMGTWQNHVDAFISLTPFQRATLVDAGLPAEKLHVKANYVAGNPTVTPWSERAGYAVFVGRLSEEKGVLALIAAWRAWGSGAPELRVVGEGPLRDELERAAQGTSVRFLGKLPASDARREIAGAHLLLLPSQWYETFGMAIVEAFASGTPAAVSKIGPLPNIVTDGSDGVVFEPGNPDSLLAVVRAVWETPGALERMGTVARQTFEAHYTEESNYPLLMEIYAAARKRKFESHLRPGGWGI